MLVAIEGPNGSGKNEISRLLAQAIKESNDRHKDRPAIRTIVTHEPTDDYFGRMIKLIIDTQGKHREIDELVKRDLRDHLDGFLGHLGVNHHYDEIADRVYSILRRLQSGELVQGLDLQFLYVIDRFYHIRNVIGPALKNGVWVLANRFVSSGPYGFAQGVPLHKMLDLEANMLEGVYIEPDMVVYLDIPAPVCIGRLKKAGEPLDIFETQYGIESVIQGYAAVLALKERQGTTVFRINADRPEEEVLQDVLGSIRNHFKSQYLNSPI